jgi:F0F1-type ATP synthase epsilon subunit
MRLELSTPTRTATYTIAWLEVNTPTGNYVIQQGHAPTMLVLSPHEEVRFRLENGKQESLLVLHGIVRIMRTHAVLVIQESNATGT